MQVQKGKRERKDSDIGILIAKERGKYADGKIVRTLRHEAEFIREKQSGERAPPPRPSPSLRDPTDTSPPRGAPQFDQLATTSHMLLLAARAANFSGSPLDRLGESVQ